MSYWSLTIFAKKTWEHNYYARLKPTALSLLYRCTYEDFACAARVGGSAALRGLRLAARSGRDFEAAHNPARDARRRVTRERDPASTASRDPRSAAQRSVTREQRERVCYPCGVALASEHEPDWLDIVAALAALG